MIEKETYEAPQVEILEVKSEGIICASGGDYIRANYLHFTSSGFGMSNELRFSGMSVRPVME